MMMKILEIDVYLLSDFKEIFIVVNMHEECFRTINAGMNVLIKVITQTHLDMVADDSNFSI